MNIHIVKGLLNECAHLIQPLFEASDFSFEKCMELQRKYDRSEPLPPYSWHGARGLLCMASATSWVPLSQEIRIPGYPLITMECFNGTPMHISITEIAYASGMLIGGLLLGLFGNYQKRILLITASIFMMGISLTISGLLPQSGFFIFVVCCAIMGLSVPFYSGVQTALFQEKIKPEYLGRVFSLTGSIMSLAMPIGLILSGFFADRIGVNHWFLLSGVLIIGIAIACPMITEVRKLDLKQNS